MSTLSAVIFSPQNIAPKSEYLKNILYILNEKEALKPLREAIFELSDTWETFASSCPEIAALKHGKRYTESFAKWIESGETSELESNPSGIIALPLLVVIHIVQYFQYLECTGIRHSDLLQKIRSGGVQGYCMGLMAAFVLAVSETEIDLVQNAASAVRITLGIAACGEIGCDPTNRCSTTMAVRLKTGITAEDITKSCPQSYVTAITDSQNISISAPASNVPELKSHIARLGLPSKMVHLHSNTHNQCNKTLGDRLLEICEKSTELQIPNSTHLQVPVRSNRTGHVFTRQCSLTAEIINTVLTVCCDWNAVTAGLAHDLQQTGAHSHQIAMIGIGDFLSLALFQQKNLDVIKIDTYTVIKESIPSIQEDFEARLDHKFGLDSIAVVGAACRLPGANDLEELWDLISRGESRVEHAREDRVRMGQSFRASLDRDWVEGREWFGNFVDNIDVFDHSFFGIGPKEATYMDPQQRLLLATAFEALDASGYLRFHHRDAGDRVGCFVGGSYTEYLENTTAHSPSPFTATGTIRAFLSGKISYHFGWTGPSEVIDTACSASLVAIHHACRAIQAGDCHMALAGGVNLITGNQNYLDLAKAGFLSKTGQCKPFDEAADGYCRADGVGLVVLKPIADAINNHDSILGVIAATATNQGGLSPGITVPHDAAQKALYRQVIHKSKIGPETITFVEAHGTGTQVGDPIEVESIREVFGGSHRKNKLYIGSLKANIGHSETAAGVASLLKVLTMFQHRGIPPQPGFTKLNPKIPPLGPSMMQIPVKLQAWETNSRVACVNGYGASGSNAAMILREWQVKNESRLEKQGAHPIMLSAHSPESLHLFAQKLASHVAKSLNSLTLGDISFTLSERRKHHRFRWTTTASNANDLVQLLRLNDDDISKAPMVPKAVIMTFSGQSKTNIGLSRDVCETYPRILDYLNQCNTVLRNLGYPDIISSLYQEDPVLDEVVLHTGTFAVQYSFAKCWLDSGLNVSAVLGHSLGELTAMAMSGVLSLEDAVKLIAKRASLIKTTWGSEPGVMLAIHTDLETVQKVLKLVQIDSPDESIEIACYNSQRSHIVVGRKSSILTAQRILEKDLQFQRIRSQLLDTTHGFHSVFTEPLLPELMGFSEILAFRSPTIPFETCTEIQADIIDSQYIRNHTRNPVYFVNAVHRLEERLGPCIWVEAGWDTPVVAMTKRALARPENHRFISMKDSPAAISSATALLFREGLSVSWWGFLSSNSVYRHVSLPACQTARTRHWLMNVDRATKALRKGDHTNLPNEPSHTLVSYIGALGANHVFQLHTNTERYKKIVSSHRVVRQPLCPVSMYMEMAIMCVKKNGLDLQGQTLSFQNLTFHSGLGCSNEHDVRLSLSKQENERSWQFLVESSKKESPRITKVKHVQGQLQTSVPEFRLYETIIPDQIDALKNDPEAERLMARSAYTLFSRVVDYGPLLQGIHSIVLGSKQAVASIRVPDNTFETRESSVSHFMDAAALDTFFQVVGLLINTSDGATDGQAFVATAVENMTILPCDFKRQKIWTVYAMYALKNKTMACGDVFVFSEDNQLSVLGSGITFSRVPINSLAKMLQGVNTNYKSPVDEEEQPLKSALVEVTSTYEEKGIEKTSLLKPVMKKSDIDDVQKREQLRAIVSGYTGIPICDIRNDESFNSLGLDSLSAMALSDDLKETFNIDLSADFLFTSDVNALYKLLLAPDKDSSIAVDSAPELATPMSSTDEENKGEIYNQDSRFSNLGTDRNINNEIGGMKNRRGSCRHKVQTIIYKEVDGTRIPADVFIPLEPPSQAMPIALMFHGGGYMTLSRKAVRPAQTHLLLEMGILPISFDYRLCPQINVIDGAMTDAKDAYVWAKRTLPGLLAAQEVSVDPSKIVIVGWSTGGHLAMTLAWTAIAAGLPPPVAILAFYCPTSYDPSDESLRMGKEYPSRIMPMSEILQRLDPNPETGHFFSSTDKTGLGWIQPGDARSELVLALIKENNGVALLLDGVPSSGDTLGIPDLERVAAISPITQVKNGKYRTPTFLIIGEEDEIVPFHTAVNFAKALENQGIKTGFISVPGAKHIHDLKLAPGSAGWNKWVLPGYKFLSECLDMYS